jgi:hypothetical protein
MIDEIARDYFLKNKLKKTKNTCLEIGCADFRQTKILQKFYKKIYCIDKYNYKKNSKFNFQKISAEKYKIPTDVKDIFLLGTIEHHDNSNLVLKKIISHLKKAGGHLHLLFNNMYSLYRIVGLQLGKIKKLNQLTKFEIKHGHQKIYDQNYFKNFFNKNNFKYEIDYILMKILPTKKMEIFYKKDYKKYFNLKMLKKYSAYIYFKANYSPR